MLLGRREHLLALLDPEELYQADHGSTAGCSLKIALINSKLWLLAQGHLPFFYLPTSGIGFRGRFLGLLLMLSLMLPLPVAAQPPDACALAPCPDAENLSQTTGQPVPITPSPGAIRLVKDINPNLAINNRSIGEPLVVGDVAYFSAETLDEGAELWKSDGTLAGTVLVADIVPGPTSSWPDVLAAISGKLPLHVTYRNRGATTALSSTLQLNLSPGLHYLGDSSGLTPTLTGTQLSWPLPDLASMEHGDITLLLEVSSGALGSRISLQMAIESAGPEASPGDNQTAPEIWLARQIWLPLTGS